jgi:hypothetical protein
MQVRGDTLCARRYFYFLDKIFNRKSHVGVSIGKILILFKQLLYDKIFLEQEKI